MLKLFPLSSLLILLYLDETEQVRQGPEQVSDDVTSLDQTSALEDGQDDGDDQHVDQGSLLVRSESLEPNDSEKKWQKGRHCYQNKCH